MDWDFWRRAQRAAAGDAFRERRADLLTAVTNVHVLANSLYSEGLISREQLEHAQLLALTPSQKKVHLFDAIEARLRSNPEDIYALTDILRSDPLLQIFVEKIWSSYQENFEKACSSYLQKDVNLYGPVVFEMDENAPPPSNPRASSFPSDDEQAELEEENEEYVEPDHDESVKKESLLSGVRRGIRKVFGAARDMTAGLIKSTLSALKLDIKIFRKYKKRFDKHTDREQVRWWFEIWGDESALKALESKWEEVSAQSKWRLETCRPVPPQKC